MIIIFDHTSAWYVENIHLNTKFSICLWRLRGWVTDQIEWILERIFGVNLPVPWQDHLTKNSNAVHMSKNINKRIDHVYTSRSTVQPHLRIPTTMLSSKRPLNNQALILTEGLNRSHENKTWYRRPSATLGDDTVRYSAPGRYCEKNIFQSYRSISVTVPQRLFKPSFGLSVDRALPIVSVPRSPGLVPFVLP